MYIGVAEVERLNILQSPEGAEKVVVDVNDEKQLVKLYERVLPYAVLFGQEKNWSKQMGKYYEQVGEAPDWYVGQGAFNAVASSSGLGGLSTAAGHASDYSSTSGGSSGGGFAGGGGGGGGGGRRAAGGGSGGADGGGAGGKGGAPGTDGADGTAGAANTGGGAGGPGGGYVDEDSRYDSKGGQAAAGGSGIVILRGTQDDLIPVVFNGTQLSELYFNGVKVTSLIYNGARLFIREVKRCFAHQAVKLC